MVHVLLYVGMAFVFSKPSPPAYELMAHATISTDKFLRRNPKWEKAVQGPDREKWLLADIKEREQHVTKGTFELVEGGRTSLSPGTTVLPIKRDVV